MLIDLGGFSVGVSDRAGYLTCMHSVTEPDIASDLCNQCITNRYETFRLTIFNNRHELYQAVISSDTLDAWAPSSK